MKFIFFAFLLILPVFASGMKTLNIVDLFKKNKIDLKNLSNNDVSLNGISASSVFENDAIDDFAIEYLFRIKLKNNFQFNKTEIFIFNDMTYFWLNVNYNKHEFQFCFGSKASCSMRRVKVPNIFDGSFHKIVVKCLNGEALIWIDCIFDSRVKIPELSKNSTRGNSKYDIKIRTSQINVYYEIKKLDFISSVGSGLIIQCSDMPAKANETAVARNTSPRTNAVNNRQKAGKNSGQKGEPGVQGPKGDKGEPELSDSSGKTGIDGLPGIPGMPGAKGEKGECISNSNSNQNVNKDELKEIILDILKDYFSSSLKESEVLWGLETPKK